jgi:hypothetical protein
MTPERERKVLASLYDRLYDAVTYSPDGKDGAFPKNIYFQMTKNTVLNPNDYKNMLSPINPKGDQRMAQAFSEFVDKMPRPGPLWSDSTQKVSQVLSTILANANEDARPTPAQQAIYEKAYNFLNVRTKVQTALGEKDKIEPSAIALAYQQARSAYIKAITGYRTAYNGYDLTKVEDQRAFNAVAPLLQNLVDDTWDAWTRGGKEEVEEAQQLLASTINDAVSFAIGQAKQATSAQFSLPSATGTGTFLPSWGLPTDWMLPETEGVKLSFKSDYLNTSDSSTAHTYGAEASGSYGLFHASASVDGSHVDKSHHMDAEKLTLEAELIAVNIMRPWFNPLLFGMKGWWVRGYPMHALSNGDPAKPAGAIPLIPTGFVVAKNVTIAADFSEEDKKFVSDSVNSKLSGGWGPFSLSGHYGLEKSN